MDAYTFKSPYKNDAYHIGVIRQSQNRTIKDLKNERIH